MDDALLELLSAYADGELDAAARARMDEALGRDEGLRRALADFRTLDKATAALPVPQIDGATGEVLWELVAGWTVHRGKEDSSAALNERLQRELAAGLAPVPEVSAERWGPVWERIRAQTVAAKRPGTAIIDRPLGDDLTPTELAVVREAHASASPAPRERKVVPIWRAAATMAAAATVLVVATIALRNPPPGNGLPPVDPGQQVATVHGPPPAQTEVLDDRYFTMVKYVPGLDKPVVCFFLKEGESGVDH